MRRSHLPAVLCTAAALGIVGPQPARAELAILTTGDFLKIDAFELRGERMRLELASGGILTVSLSLIERIVDDELPREPPLEPEPEAEAAFALGFEDSAPVPETPYGELIYETARSQGVNPVLVAAMVRAESAFLAQAVSAKGARGLMQLMPATAARFGVAHEELFDPARNLEAGTRYLSWLVDRFEHDLPRVLAAYNAGEGAVARYGGVPPYRETRDYLQRIYRTLGLAAEAAAGGSGQR